MKKNSIEIKIYKAIFCMLLIAAIVIIGMIVYKYGSNQINEKQSQEVVNAFSNIDFSKNEEESGSLIQLQYKGYDVIGIVKIPKINIEYPILEIGNIDPNSAEKPMKLSIIKYWGENVIKEEIITQETTKLPITYDSIALFVILGIIVALVIVVFIRIKKLSNQNEEK